MARIARVIPLRFFGQDVRTVVDTQIGTAFYADDVCAVLGLPIVEKRDTWGHLESREHPGTVWHIDVAGLGLVDVYTEPEVRVLAAEQPDFLAFIARSLRDLLAPQVRRATRSQIADQAAPEIWAGTTYSVRAAAGILSRDPAIELGQKALFATLRDLEWIRKDLDVWVPAQTVLDAGLLVRHRVPVVKGRAGREIYPQVRITRAGMADLHTRLGGVTDLDFNPPRHLELVDDTTTEDR